MRRWLCASVLVLAASACAAEDGQWKLVFEDRFQRTELGPDWVEAKNVSIVNGRLFLKGRADARLRRGYPGDVKVEFVAEADPEQPPCDLAVTLANTFLLAFGGGNNTFNQIVGPDVTVRDNNPPFPIEHGRKYKIVAVKEGPVLILYCNDQKLLEAKLDDPLGGPEFDGVALTTWNGMYVDYIKVFERTTPAPGGPVFLRAMPVLGFTWKDRQLSYSGPAKLPPQVGEAIRLYNDRKYQEAFDTLSAISPATLESVAALAYVVGDLAFLEKPAHQAEVTRLATEVAAKDPQNVKAKDFALAARWFGNFNVYRRNHQATRRLIGCGPDNNPFYYKARLFETRFNYAHAVEGAHREGMQAAINEFAELKKIWPEHQALREWTGERIPWGQELIRPESDGPAWARHLQESLARQQAVLRWWFTERQLPDGQLGGGWGDDVEILRGWVPIACITTAAEPAVAGIERLAQGVWDHVLKDGYDPFPGDVEHSAEPSCDSLPTMIVLRYGDPLWLERNLRSAKTVREKFMDLNERGFLQFMSRDFGTDGVKRGLGNGGDSGYHARATKHFIYLGWYGVPEGRDAFVQWCDTWRDATMRQIGPKPAGFPPATLWFPSGDIAPPDGKPWYDEHRNSYGFPGLPVMIYESFTTAYLLTNDRKFLDPLQSMMDKATAGPLHKGDPKLPPDHIENLMAQWSHMASADVLSPYRLLTGERVYDEYILRMASPTQRYMVDYDLPRYARTFEKTANSLRYNWTQLTSEILQTDRAGLVGSAEVFGAYTGAVCSFRDSKPPTISVTYDTPDLNFAAVVTETTAQRLRVMFYNFNAEPMRVGLRPWRLTPGIYVLNAGRPVPGEYDFQKRYTWTGSTEVEHLHRGTPIWVEVPSHKEWVVDLRLRKTIERPAVLPDLAIASRDIQVKDGKVVVRVHNIGGAAAAAFKVVAEAKDGNKWTQVADAEVDGLPAIRNFEPSVREVALNIDPARFAGVRIRLDPHEKVEELYELNNTATLK
ncbi:MAG: hypothetical protein ACUVXJ_14575, partial [Phycisphaerae bacterium]